jgi:hypothetical protein
MAAPVVGYNAIAALEEEQHLRVPVIGRQGSAVAEHDGLTFAPVLVEDLKAVFGGDRAHGEPPCTWNLRYEVIPMPLSRQLSRPASRLPDPSLERGSRRLSVSETLPLVRCPHRARPVNAALDEVGDFVVRLMRPRICRKRVAVKWLSAISCPPVSVLGSGVLP